MGMAKPIPWVSRMIMVLTPCTLAAFVDQGAAAVAGVDRRVGLQHDLAGVLVLAVAGKDAGGDGVAQSHRVADGEHLVALAQAAVFGRRSQRRRL